MKANKTVQNLKPGVNGNGNPTSPFGHEDDSMGGIIDNAICSGKFLSLEALLITLNTVEGPVTARKRKPQNNTDESMTAMKIKPHLQWLGQKGGFDKAVSVFGKKRGPFIHGLAKHASQALLAEIKGLKGANVA